MPAGPGFGTQIPEEVLRVLLIAPDPLVRAGLVAQLSTSLELVLVGQASSGAEARRLLPVGTADVALWDVGLTSEPGLPQLDEVDDAWPPLVLLVPDAQLAHDAFQAG